MLFMVVWWYPGVPKSCLRTGVARHPVRRMRLACEQRDAARMIRHRLAPAAAVGAALALPLAACGSSSDNSKPAYCNDRDQLQQSISGIKDISLDKGAISALQTQLKTVDADAKQLVSTAKGEFPTETGAISTATSELSSAVSDLSSSPSASSVAAVVAGVTGVVDSVKGFTQATDNTCS
jgi:hypothetical protein